MQCALSMSPPYMRALLTPTRSVRATLAMLLLLMPVCSVVLVLTAAAKGAPPALCVALHLRCYSCCHLLELSSWYLWHWHYSRQLLAVWLWSLFHCFWCCLCGYLQQLCSWLDLAYLQLEAAKTVWLASTPQPLLPQLLPPVRTVCSST